MLYDVVFSLGGACSCTQTLRKLNLQFASYPFDWIVGSSFLERVQILSDEFEGWFEKQDLQLVPSPDWERYSEQYLNTKTQISYRHDFLKGIPFTRAYRSVKHKYRRRIKRLLNELNAANSLLAVWISPPSDPRNVSLDEVKSAYETLSRKFPNGNVHLLVLNYEQDTAIAKEEMVVPGAKSVTLDYKDHTGASFPYSILFEKIAPYFKDVQVVDKRTLLDKLAFILKKRYFSYRTKRARYRVRTLIGYIYVSAQYRLYRHLEKALKKRGVHI